MGEVFFFLFVFFIPPNIRMKEKPLLVQIYLFFVSFTNAKIQRQKPSHKKNTSGTVQTEAYFIFNIANIYSQLGFFWSDLK